MAVVAMAAAAWAQPLLLTQSRREGWNARTSRVILVDTSASMARPDGSGRRASAEASVAAAAEAAGPGASVRVEEADLRAGLRQAVARLSGMEPSRREIVVISDFQRGALAAADLSVVPPAVGLRFVKVGGLLTARHLAGTPRIDGGRTRSVDIHLDGDSTAVTVGAAEAAAGGLRLIAPPGADESLARVSRSLAAAGTPAPSPEQPIVIEFAGAPHETVRPVAAGWMLETVLRLRHDRDADSLAREFVAAPALSGDAPWFVVFRDRLQRPVVTAAALGRELTFQVAAPPGSLMAAAVVRGALVARAGTGAAPEQEVQVVPDAERSTWARAPSPITPEAWQQSDVSDARWLWAACLLLLGVEWRLRQERGSSRQEVHADAA
jgi:hypothetical protein